jgi:hypothetical protein
MANGLVKELRASQSSPDSQGSSLHGFMNELVDEKYIKRIGKEKMYLFKPLEKRWHVSNLKDSFPTSCHVRLHALVCHL